MFLLRPDLLLEALPVMGWGMLGVFLMTGLIIAVVSLLNHFGGGKQRKKDGPGRIQ